jgi:hypothetical protein
MSVRYYRTMSCMNLQFAIGLQDNHIEGTGVGKTHTWANVSQVGSSTEQNGITIIAYTSNRVY